jgi:hypothetical protein
MSRRLLPTMTGSLTTSQMSAARKIIDSSFTAVQAIPSKPLYNVTSDFVVVTTYYYVSDSKHAVSDSVINSTAELLSDLFRVPVQVEAVRLHHPHLDAHVLARYISMNSAHITFSKILEQLWATNVISQPVPTEEENKGLLVLPPTGGGVVVPTYLTGVKVKLSGRLDNERSTPRQSVQEAQVGTFSSKAVHHTDRASYTSKNNKGSFTVKVWLAQSLLQP